MERERDSDVIIEEEEARWDRERCGCGERGVEVGGDRVVVEDEWEWEWDCGRLYWLVGK